jgi:hypothetical protein
MSWRRDNDHDLAVPDRASCTKYWYTMGGEKMMMIPSPSLRPARGLSLSSWTVNMFQRDRPSSFVFNVRVTKKIFGTCTQLTSS